jgi:hypothetical protein
VAAYVKQKKCVRQRERTIRRVEYIRDKRRDNKEKWFRIIDTKFLSKGVRNIQNT